MSDSESEASVYKLFTLNHILPTDAEEDPLSIDFVCLGPQLAVLRAYS